MFLRGRSILCKVSYKALEGSQTRAQRVLVLKRYKQWGGACKRHLDTKVSLRCQRINVNEYVINVLHKICLLHYGSWALPSWLWFK